MTSYGKNIKIEVFGGSHDSEIGITAENIPAGITFDMDKLQAFMQRRAPGQSKLTTSRKESDTPVLMSGFDGSTTNGEKIRIIIRNENARSSDYSSLSSKPRPSHADYPAMVKSGGKVDLRGGGHFPAGSQLQYARSAVFSKRSLKNAVSSSVRILNPSEARSTTVLTR